MVGTPSVLWLLPPAAERAHYTRVIETLSRRFGTVPFEPHLTLAPRQVCSEVEAVQRTKELAENLAPVPVRFDSVDGDDEYFRCVYLRAASTAVLRTAHLLACQHLGQPPKVDFLPHLSLVYGHLSTPQKQLIAAELAEEVPASFVIGHIGLYQVTGPPQAWRLIEAFALTGRG